MKVLSLALLSFAILFSGSSKNAQGRSSPADAKSSLFGFRDGAAESAIESRFLAVPDAKLAEEHLRTLTKEPHMAGTPEASWGTRSVPTATGLRYFCSMGGCGCR